MLRVFARNRVQSNLVDRRSVQTAHASYLKIVEATAQCDRAGLAAAGKKFDQSTETIQRQVVLLLHADVGAMLFPKGEASVADFDLDRVIEYSQAAFDHAGHLWPMLDRDRYSRVVRLLWSSDEADGGDMIVAMFILIGLWRSEGHPLISIEAAQKHLAGQLSILSA